MPFGVLVWLAASDPLTDWLGKAGGPAVLAFIIILLLRGDLVTGREAKQLRIERDRAVDLVYKQAEVTQRALDVAEKK